MADSGVGMAKMWYICREQAQQHQMKLNSGYEIPSPGFGTFKTPDGDICTQSVVEAVKAGYRHIDTAAIYGNERSTGLSPDGFPGRIHQRLHCYQPVF